LPAKVKSKRKRKAKPGRPPAKFDLAQIASLSQLGCTDEEIAAFFSVDRKTIQRHKAADAEFAAALVNGALKGNISLRRVQFKAALEGDRTMMIWMGKQRLGQRDKVDAPTGADVVPATKIEYRWIMPTKPDDKPVPNLALDAKDKPEALTN
jgi:hypothetical protein